MAQDHGKYGLSHRLSPSGPNSPMHLGPYRLRPAGCSDKRDTACFRAAKAWLFFHFPRWMPSSGRHLTKAYYCVVPCAQILLHFSAPVEEATYSPDRVMEGQNGNSASMSSQAEQR